MNKNAVYERIGKSEQWLLWLCQNIYREQRALVAKPAWLVDKDVCLIDASDEPVYGSKQADYRLHYCVDLFSLRVHEMRLTAAKQGEKLTNFERVGERSVVVAPGTFVPIVYSRHSARAFPATRGYSLCLADFSPHVWDSSPQAWDLNPQVWDLNPLVWDSSPQAWDLNPQVSGFKSASLGLKSAGLGFKSASLGLESASSGAIPTSSNILSKWVTVTTS